MTQISKLLDDQVVEKAKAQLHKVGKTALMTRKLEAIISAKKHGISKVAEIYDITRKTLTSWIKCVKNDNLSGLSAPAERKRKNKLNDAQRAGIMEWLKADSQLTLEAIRLKIKEQYNIEISKSTVHREIQKQNYSYIKPRPQHFKQDQNQVTEFKKRLTTKSLNTNHQECCFLTSRDLALIQKLAAVGLSATLGQRSK